MVERDKIKSIEASYPIDWSKQAQLTDKVTWARARLKCSADISQTMRARQLQQLVESMTLVPKYYIAKPIPGPSCGMY
jgi:hypothetical protein